MQLAELQQAFWAAVRTRGSPPPGIASWCTGSRAQTPGERLAVYHLAYWHRQLAALSATFPRTQALLAGSFERLVFAYVESCPCRESCIERLGAGFPEFLGDRDEVSPATLGVARLEWAATSALLAPNPHCVQELPRHLGARFAECRLDFAPSLHTAHVGEAALRWFETAESGAPALDASSPIAVAFYRPRFAVRHVVLPPDEARALALGRGGATIADICTQFSDLPEDRAATRALAVLRGWFARGWLTGCEP